MTLALPSTNRYGIADLRPDMQGCVTRPVRAWGELKRLGAMPGTWVFYTDDYRFSALYGHPEKILDTGCAGAVEPNPTLWPDAPLWECIGAVGQKRALARTWQDLGVPVFVDLNVPHRRLELNQLGVPAGWVAYATRGYAARPDDLEAEHAWAWAHAGPGLRLLVYGGGRTIEDVCRRLPGAVWCPGRGDLREQG